MSFPSPVAITANTTYVASYFAPAGHYAGDGSYFAASGFDNAPLHALSNGVSPNGVYHYTESGFPSDSFLATNYWVDVVFTTIAGDNTAPTVSSKLPAANATGVAPNSTVAATFSEAVQATTVTFTLTGPGKHSGARDRELRRGQRPFDPHTRCSAQRQHDVHGSCERRP